MLTPRELQLLSFLYLSDGSGFNIPKTLDAAVNNTNIAIGYANTKEKRYNRLTQIHAKAIRKLLYHAKKTGYLK